MAPHLWQGPTAAQDWYRDVLNEGPKHGASGYFVTLGELLQNLRETVRIGWKSMLRCELEASLIAPAS